MAPGEATPPRIDHLLNPQNVDHGTPSDPIDADVEPPPTMPEAAELEVLPGLPSSLPPAPPQGPVPPTLNDMASHVTVGNGQRAAPSSTHFNNANDAYFVYLTRDRQQMNSQRRAEHYDDRLPHRNGRRTWPSFRAPQFKYHK